MTNPYRAPSPSENAEARLPTGSARSTAVLCFGLFPAAIIIARVMEAIESAVQGWDLFYWGFAVLPPAYMTAAWLFAVRSERQGTDVRRSLLPAALMPLVLFLIFVWCVTIYSLHQSREYELTGWLAMDHLLWLASSVPIFLYFAHSIRMHQRSKWP